MLKKYITCKDLTYLFTEPITSEINKLNTFEIFLTLQGFDKLSPENLGNIGLEVGPEIIDNELHWGSCSGQVTLKGVKFASFFFGGSFFRLDKFGDVKPHGLEFDLKLSDGEEELVDSSVGLDEILADNKVDGPIDFEVEVKIAPVTVVERTGFTNHFPLF